MATTLAISQRAEDTANSGTATHQFRSFTADVGGREEAREEGSSEEGCCEENRQEEGHGQEEACRQQEKGCTQETLALFTISRVLTGKSRCSCYPP